MFGRVVILGCAAWCVCAPARADVTIVSPGNRTIGSFLLWNGFPADQFDIAGTDEAGTFLTETQIAQDGSASQTSINSVVSAGHIDLHASGTASGMLPDAHSLLVFTGHVFDVAHPANVRIQWSFSGAGVAFGACTLGRNGGPALRSFSYPDGPADETISLQPGRYFFGADAVAAAGDNEGAPDSSFSLHVALDVTETPAGAVDQIEGEVTAVGADGVPRVLRVGDPIWEDDLVSTLANSAVSILFQDNSTIAMGADTRLRISEYLFEPEGGGGSSFFEFLQGAFVYVSGLIPAPRVNSLAGGGGGIRAAMIINEVQSTTQEDIYLIDGAVTHPAAPGVVFTGPVTIHVQGGSVTTDPLSQAEYDSIAATIGPSSAPAVPALPAIGAAALALLLGGMATLQRKRRDARIS